MELTTRERIYELLRASPKALTGREIARRVKTRERDVYEHILHIALSSRRRGEVVVIFPAKCEECGFAFEPEKVRKPGRCPVCHSTKIDGPRFLVRESEWSP